MDGSPVSAVKSAVASVVPVRLRRRQGDLSIAPSEVSTYRTACAAPSIQLRFDANGLVTTCCRTLQPLGHISRDRLVDIWAGQRRNDVVTRLERDDFSAGCQPCGAEIQLEGRASSYAAIHDELATHLTSSPASRAWPTRMEFNLSNACNLMCIQCDGESSSSIRAHREGRAPLPKVYGDEFFDDLRLFLPHLDQIVFAGGEPFLGSENFRVWDLIAEVRPDLDVMVVTNATQWNPRVEAVLERLRFGVVISLDGISKPTYESIRVGADFDQVMENVERFITYAGRVGTPISINHCLMPQNYHEFGDLLLWAEAKALPVAVSVVRTPANACIAALPVGEIRRIHDELSRCNDRMENALSLNLSTWTAEYRRVAAWAAADEGHGDAASGHTVLWFRCAGTRPWDDNSARHSLEAFAVDGKIHTITVGVDGLVGEADTALIDGSRSVVGAPYQQFTNAVTDRYGVMTDYEVRSTSDDQVEASAVFGTTPARITSVALRDERGWATSARILVAFGAP